MANLYAKGYSDGFKAGLLKGRNEATEAVVRNDLTSIYGMMCIMLHDKGYQQDEIEQFCVNIQEMWVDEYQDMLEKSENGIKNDFRQKVFDITGIDLKQIFGLE